MDRAVYEKMKQYDRVASWALWDSNNIASTKIIDDAVEKLKSNIIFIALNFAGDGKQDIMLLSCKGIDPQPPSWQNFHYPCGSDPRLRDALNSTRYEGAYMTDIIKNSATPDAAALMKKIKNKEIDMDQQIKILTDEITSLDVNFLEIYFFGRDAYSIYTQYVERNDYFKRNVSQKIKLCKQIDRYSKANTRFPKKIKEQLDLSTAIS